MNYFIASATAVAKIEDPSLRQDGMTIYDI